MEEDRGKKKEAKGGKSILVEKRQECLQYKFVLGRRTSKTE